MGLSSPKISPASAAQVRGIIAARGLRLPVLWRSLQRDLLEAPAIAIELCL